MATLKTATVLAFERKLDPSDAIFYAADWDAQDAPSRWKPVKLREKSVRGTISNRLKANNQDPAKLDAAIQNPNLQTVDVAALPPEHDTLVVSFSLRVLGGTGVPSACNSVEYQGRLQSVVQAYVAAHGFNELARRYVANLANARFLWRNRIGAQNIQVRVEQMQGGKALRIWNFNSLEQSLRGFDTDHADLKSLAEVLAQALRGEGSVLLQITAFARVGAGQEVFPSQELILERARGDKSKTLYEIGEPGREIAAMHSQKVGNALRTIDTWYEGAEDFGPIAVEPYGSVTTQGKAFRPPRKMDFYGLLDDWLLKDKTPPVEQQHFVMAVLVRGGVFGEAG